jgi:hypothetical protein
MCFHFSHATWPTTAERIYRLMRLLGAGGAGMTYAGYGSDISQMKLKWAE